MLQQALQLGRWCFWRLAFALLLAALSSGCSQSLPQRTVSQVRIVETSPSEVNLDDVLAGLGTAAPRKFLWLERERDVYDPNLVAHDLERIERYYQSQGYYDVKVVAARVESVGPREVEIEVRVMPGQRVTVRSVSLDEHALLGLGSAYFKRKQVRPPQVGAPFSEALLNNYKTALLDVLKEASFAYAKVRVTAKVDLNAHAADVAVEMQPGKRARFGEIRIIGLKQIPESKVRAALSLKQGDPYSDDEQEDARQALAAMQLFTHIEVSPDLSNPDNADVPILVTLQEDQLRKLLLGGGTVVDALKLEAHLRSGWEHKNFLGGARRFAIEATGGFDFFPTRLESFSTLVAPTNAFFVLDSSVTLEQPAIFNGRTKGSVQLRYARAPLLYSPAPKDPRAEIVIGYNRPSGTLALERGFLGQRIVLRPSYNLEARVPFSLQNQLPTELQTVWVSYPQLFALFQLFQGDLSKDRSKRDYSLSFRNTVSLAGLKLGGRRWLGGSLSDLKIEPELRGVAPIFAHRRNPEQLAGDLTLAGRVKLGFILAPDYGSSLRTDRPDATPTSSSSEDQQKLLSRAFYSGGATSNRGYTESSISPAGPVGFLIPTGFNCGAAEHQNDPTCIRPLGGFTQWEASLELRYAGFYPLTLVAFADAADVTRDIGHLQFQYPHLSVGPGVRYESPVGPIRLDFGIRVPGAQALGSSGLPADHSHGQEPPDFLRLPAVIHLAIGDAY